MEECEALCSRIGIQVSGYVLMPCSPSLFPECFIQDTAFINRYKCVEYSRLVCLGSAQHLKERFGKGYQIDINAKDEAAIDAVKIFVSKNFDDAKLLEQHKTRLTYRVAKTKTLADMFRCDGDGVDEIMVAALVRVNDDGDGDMVMVIDLFVSLYRLIEKEHDAIGVSEYSISETSLEQIFIQFARDQDEHVADVPAGIAAKS